MSRRITIAAYLAIQAFLVSSWWAAIYLYPHLIPLFRSESSPNSAILDLWLADLTLVAAGSAFASALVAKNMAAQLPAVWMLVGAISYATLLPIGSTLRSGGGGLAVALMSCAAIMTVACAIFVTRK